MSDMQKQQPDAFDLFLSKSLHNQQDYLDDAGFTNKVMFNLPAARKLPKLWLFAISFLPVLFIGVALIFWFGVNELVGAGYRLTLLASHLTPLQLATIVAVTCLAGVGGWLVNQLKLI